MNRAKSVDRRMAEDCANRSAADHKRRLAHEPHLHPLNRMASSRGSTGWVTTTAQYSIVPPGGDDHSLSLARPLVGPGGCPEVTMSMLNRVDKPQRTRDHLSVLETAQILHLSYDAAMTLVTTKILSSRRPGHHYQVRISAILTYLPTAGFTPEEVDAARQTIHQLVQLDTTA